MDSNHRPTDYESAALTAVLRALQCLAGEASSRVVKTVVTPGTGKASLYLQVHRTIEILKSLKCSLHGLCGRMHLTLGNRRKHRSPASVMAPAWDAALNGCQIGRNIEAPHGPSGATSTGGNKETVVATYRAQCRILPRSRTCEISLIRIP